MKVLKTVLLSLLTLAQFALGAEDYYKVRTFSPPIPTLLATC
jgi:hypothetical protein